MALTDHCCLFYFHVKVCTNENKKIQWFWFVALLHKDIYYLGDSCSIGSSLLLSWKSGNENNSLPEWPFLSNNDLASLIHVFITRRLDYSNSIYLRIMNRVTLTLSIEPNCRGAGTEPISYFIFLLFLNIMLWHSSFGNCPHRNRIEW